MEIVISILVYLGALLTHVYYPQSYVDQQIESHKPQIDAVMANSHQMSQVKMCKIGYDRPGFVVVTYADEDLNEQ